MKTILGLVMCILLIHELFLFFWINIIVSEYLNLGQGQVNGADILTVIGTTVLVTFQFVFRAKERVFGVSSIMIFVALNILQNQISLAIIGVGSCLYAHKTYNSFDVLMILYSKVFTYLSPSHVDGR